jgi:hypothetical protein
MTPFARPPVTLVTHLSRRDTSTALFRPDRVPLLGALAQPLPDGRVGTFPRTARTSRPGVGPWSGEELRPAKTPWSVWTRPMQAEPVSGRVRAGTSSGAPFRMSGFVDTGACRAPAARSIAPPATGTASGPPVCQSAAPASGRRCGRPRRRRSHRPAPRRRSRHGPGPAPGPAARSAQWRRDRRPAPGQGSVEPTGRVRAAAWRRASLTPRCSPSSPVLRLPLPRRPPRTAGSA